MTIYLGPVGNLQALPSIGRGIKADIALGTSVHEIAGTRGGRVVDRVGTPKRTFTLARDWLTLDELSTVECIALGGCGAGPYVLLEPWRRNLLSANQSSGTDVLRDTTDFRALTGTITSSTAQFDTPGMRSLAWAVTAANQQVLTGAGVGTADPLVDPAVLPSTVHSARCTARLSTSTGTARLDVQWFTAAGTFISASTGTATALNTSGFTALPCVNVTSPSTAALARLLVTNTVMGAAQTIYLDKFQLQQAAALDAWTIGTGVPRVSFTESFGQEYQVLPYVNGSITLTEI